MIARRSPVGSSQLERSVTQRGLAAALVLGLASASPLTGCAGTDPVIAYPERVDQGRARAASGQIQLRWSRRLTPDLEGAYLPVERAVPALDAMRDRIYVGTSTGQVWAFDGAGGRLWMYQTGGGIGNEPALSADGLVLYVGSDDGFLHALQASEGTQLWQTEMRGALGNKPLVTDDVVYIATENDVIEAFDRRTGEALWRFERQPTEGFYVTEHAGLALADRRLLTGFTDGAVVALDPGDGRVLWTRETAADAPAGRTDDLRFTDVDTTPLVVGQTIYVASFAAGLYALEASSGSVLWRRSEWTGVTGITEAPGGQLILSSGDLGVVAVRARDGERVWETAIPRGAPTGSRIAGELVLVGESAGGLLGLSLGAGREVARIEDGHGFGAPVAWADGLGAVVSNTGTLFVFRVGEEPRPRAR